MSPPEHRRAPPLVPAQPIAQAPRNRSEILAPPPVPSQPSAQAPRNGSVITPAPSLVPAQLSAQPSRNRSETPAVTVRGPALRRSARVRASQASRNQHPSQ